jgi:adenylate kinase family enzyme
MQATQPIELGRRVVVWGVTGSGKSTFARHLGDALGLAVVELDAIRHANGWDSTGWDDFRAILTQRIESYEDGWVCEGSYHQIMHVYLSRADTLIWLRLPWRVTFWRLLQRTVARAIDQKPLYNENGPHESWRQSFLSRRSILWWSISMHRPSTRSRRERIAALPPHVRVHELRSPREVREFLSRLPMAAQTPNPR